jgi:MurNAc alpha-1-phosphate uridylyltransferase
LNLFLLAAGFGTRMKEYTQDLPKPLLSIRGMRLLDISLVRAKEWGVKEGIINTHYQGSKIHSYLEKFQGFPIKISEESCILGTGGGIYTGLQRFPGSSEDNWLVMNPDTILMPENSDFNPNTSFYPGSLFHLYLKPYPKDANYTKLYLKDGKVTFDEVKDSKICYFIGLSIFHPTAFANQDLRIEEPFELIQVWKHLSKHGLLSGEIFLGEAIDIGEKKLYESLQEKNLFSNEDEWKIKIQNLYGT